jgi:hypothetical protein
VAKANKRGRVSGGNGKRGGAAADVRFAAQVGKIVKGIDAATVAFDGFALPELTSDQRLTSIGRLRQGEADAILAVLDTMDQFPGIFAALAAKDGGVDPNEVETEPARSALARALALAPLAKAMDALAQKVSDAIMASAQQAKELSIAAYQIGKLSAAADPGVAKAMAAPMNFYGYQGQRRKMAKKRAAASAKRNANKGNADEAISS